MTRNQLENIVRTYGTGKLPGRILLLLVAFITRAAQEIAGVPSLAAPAAPTTPEGMAGLIQALVPGNGYKLEMRRGIIRLVVALIMRYRVPLPAPAITGFAASSQNLSAGATASFTVTSSNATSINLYRGGALEATLNAASGTINSQALAAGSYTFTAKAVRDGVEGPASLPEVVGVASTPPPPPPPVTYARTMTVVGGQPATGYGISLAGADGAALEFNDTPSQGGNPLSMILNIGGNPVAQVDFDPVYNGAGFRFSNGGQSYNSTFQASAGLNLA